MKRLKLVLVLLLSFSLTGCIQKYTVTEEQDDAVAEYMAGLLLNNDEDYDQELIPMEEISADNPAADNTASEENKITPTVAPDATNEDNPSNSDSTDNQKEYTISEVIGTENFDIQYKDYKLTETYPEDPESAYFSLNSRPGYQLLVVIFSVKNKADKDEAFDLSKSGVEYQLDINVGTIYKPQFTLLENDLRYIDVTIKGGDTIEAYLVFEVSKDLEISNINLLVSKDSRSEIVEIK